MPWWCGGARAWSTNVPLPSSSSQPILDHLIPLIFHVLCSFQCLCGGWRWFWITVGHTDGISKMMSGNNMAFVLFYFILFYFCCLGPHPRHMEVPRLGVKWELQPLAYTTATALWDPNHVFDLQHSSWQCWILNPLSKARDWTHIIMVTSRIHFRCTMTRTLAWDGL